MHQDYFAKDFDPNKVTIRRLKEILNAHDIPYKDITRKADFVHKFNEHVLPIVEIQRKEEERGQKGATELKQERKTPRDHRVRKSVTDQEEEITPSVSNSQTKLSQQRKRKTGRSSSKRQKEEKVTQPHVIQNDGQSSRTIIIDDNSTQPQDSGHKQQISTTQGSLQNLLRQNYSERLSPPRPLKAPTSPTPFYPIVPPYSRTPAYPFLEPEELEAVKRKDQELQQSSERQEKPIQRVSENRTEPSEDKINYFERREAFAYCFRPQVSKKHIDRRPPPEFIKKKPRIRLNSKIFFLFFSFILVFLYLSLKTRIGFCDSCDSCDDESISDREIEKLPSLYQLVIDKVCTPCPPKATCLKGIITECEQGFKRETSFFRITKPYYTHCAIDKDQITKEKKYTKEFKEIISRETGRVKCGYDNKDNLIDENLKLQLKEKMPSQDYKYINITHGVILSDDEFEQHVDENGRVYIISRKPTYSFYCQLTNALVGLVKTIFDNLFYSLLVASTLSALLFGTLYIRQWIWERGQVRIAYDLALTRLREQKKIIGLEFREEAFAHVKDPMVRLQLFNKLDKKVRAYPYVRAMNTIYNGYEDTLWEWKAPTTSRANQNNRIQQLSNYLFRPVNVPR